MIATSFVKPSLAAIFFLAYPAELSLAPSAVLEYSGNPVFITDGWVCGQGIGVYLQSLRNGRVLRRITTECHGEERIGNQNPGVTPHTPWWFFFNIK
jgi:hypothetical protein